MAQLSAFLFMTMIAWKAEVLIHWECHFIEIWLQSTSDQFPHFQNFQHFWTSRLLCKIDAPLGFIAKSCSEMPKNVHFSKQVLGGSWISQLQSTSAGGWSQAEDPKILGSPAWGRLQHCIYFGVMDPEASSIPVDLRDISFDVL